MKVAHSIKVYCTVLSCFSRKNIEFIDHGVIVKIVCEAKWFVPQSLILKQRWQTLTSPEVYFQFGGVVIRCTNS